MDATVDKYTEKKRKDSNCKESNKFAKQLNLTSKNIDIKHKAIEIPKNIKKEAKTQILNQYLKRPWN